MDLGCDQQDGLKFFYGGFSIVKKDQAFAKRSIKYEADWWIAPHRSSELQSYRKIVMKLSRAIRHPDIAIRFDVDARDRYAKHPFHMDDRSEFHVPLFRKCYLASGILRCKFPGCEAERDVAW
jgi:hypothetical protein